MTADEGVMSVMEKFFNQRFGLGANIQSAGVHVIGRVLVIQKPFFLDEVGVS